MLPGDLLAVSPALGFVPGGFQAIPELEDLHAAMIEDGLSPAQRRVMHILDGLRPAPAAAPAPSSSAAAAATSADAPGAAATAVAAPVVPLPSLTTLDPRFWSGRGKDASAPEFDSRRLMSLLSRVASSSDSQDPAASQARHQKPVGHVALWPELPLLGHSCAPNTSQMVIADRLFLHVTDEMPAGGVLTRNMIGPAIAAPLALRQLAVGEALADVGAAQPAALPAAGDGEGEEEGAGAGALLPWCRCRRCALEASVSERLREALEDAHNWFVDEASVTWNRANAAEDVGLLRELLAEAETMVAEVEEAVQQEPGLDDEQQDLMRAGAYDTYDLLVTLDELVNQEEAEPDYLQACLELIRVFAPGSDNHFMVGLKNESLRRHRFDMFNEMLQREGRGASSRDKAVKKSDLRKLESLKKLADTAAELRIEAVILRYGYVTEAILAQLTEGMETYVEGLQRIGEMEAAGVSEMSREMDVDGVRVQIVDRLEVSEGAKGVAGVNGSGVEVHNEEGLVSSWLVNAGEGSGRDRIRGDAGSGSSAEEEDGWFGADEAGAAEDGAEEGEEEGPSVDLETMEDLEAMGERRCAPCAAAKPAKKGGRGGGQGFRGFGDAPKAPPKPQRDLKFDEDEEQEPMGPAAAAAAQGDDDEEEIIKLKAPYQMYNDGGYKAQRYLGPLVLRQPEGNDLRKLESPKKLADTAAELRIEAIILRYGYVTEAILAQLTEGMETYVEGLQRIGEMEAAGVSEMSREMDVDGVRVQIVDRLEVSEGAKGVAGVNGSGVEVHNEEGL
ncbi:hypothetical protein TSOC_006938, partial [Tetrabaena socialis]